MYRWNSLLLFFDSPGYRIITGVGGQKTQSRGKGRLRMSSKKTTITNMSLLLPELTFLKSRASDPLLRWKNFILFESHISRPDNHLKGTSPEADQSSAISPLWRCRHIQNVKDSSTKCLKKIAAIAYANSAVLVTRNISDFKWFSDIDIVNWYSL